MAVRVKRKTNMKGLGCENGITLYEKGSEKCLCFATRWSNEVLYEILLPSVALP